MPLVRHRARWAAIGLAPFLAMLAIASAAFATPAFAEPAEQVPACDTLVALRILTAAAPDRAAALARASGQPGCKLIPRAGIGAVEHRAMIGGAPFECLAVKGEPACLWVEP